MRPAIAVTFLVGLSAFCCIAQDGVGPAVRAELSLNNNWSYVLNRSQNHIPNSGWQIKRVPELPIEDGTASVWYQQMPNIPSAWVVPGRRYFLRIGKAGHYAAVYWNGVLMGEHFGQFSPFEIEITNVVSGTNIVDIYVHKADTKYVRPGTRINESGCPQDVPDCIGNAYRPHALQGALARNWVGLAGDVTFSWRPGQYLAEVFPATSVRNSNITISISVNGTGKATMVEATVLDGSTVVLAIPPQPLSGETTLSSAWTNPILWGQPPYGQPKLYTLRTDLLDSSGTILDSRFDRFGFREVWVSGKDVLLNSQRLWAVGEYPSTIDPVVYVNDRRPGAFWLHIIEQAGFTSFSGHWDDLNDATLDLADEMGILVVASVYCSGPESKSKVEVDDVNGWTNWMTSTITEWVDAVKNHPSIVMWRPTDLLPGKVNPSAAWPVFAAAVRASDPAQRPIADGSDVDWWDENWGINSCDDGSAFAARLAQDSKPLFTKEVTGSPTLPCVPNFFNTFYGLSYGSGSGGAVGLHLGRPIVFNDQPFQVSWFSISGKGNRPLSSAFLPNWIARTFTPTPLAKQFAGLFQTYTGLPILNSSPTSGDYQASGVPSGASTAFLSSQDAAGNPVGVEVAGDGSGTAWFVLPNPGTYTFSYNPGTGDVSQTVNVTAPTPF